MPANPAKLPDTFLLEDDNLTAMSDDGTYHVSTDVEFADDDDDEEKLESAPDHESSCGDSSPDYAVTPGCPAEGEDKELTEGNPESYAVMLFFREELLIDISSSGRFPDNDAFSPSLLTDEAPEGSINADEPVSAEGSPFLDFAPPSWMLGAHAHSSLFTQSLHYALDRRTPPDNNITSRLVASQDSLSGASLSNPVTVNRDNDLEYSAPEIDTSRGLTPELADENDMSDTTLVDATPEPGIEANVTSPSNNNLRIVNIFGTLWIYSDIYEPIMPVSHASPAEVDTWIHGGGETWDIPEDEHEIVSILDERYMYSPSLPHDFLGPLRRDGGLRK